MELNEAVKAVLDECPNQYAKSYASGMVEARLMYGKAGEKSQILYILENIKGWRGERAKEVRKILKSHAN